MTLWQDIQPYLDKQTGLLPARDGGNDNLILYSALLYRELGRLKDPGCLKFVTDCELFLRECTIAQGVYLRGPDRFQDGNSVDNAVGAAFVDPDCAKEMDRIAWPYLDPTNRRDSYRRFIGLKPYLKAASGQLLSWHERLLWSLVTFFSIYSDKGHTDRLLIHSLQCSVMEHFGYCTWACRAWRKHYSVPDLLADWFGKDHPLAIWARKPSA